VAWSKSLPTPNTQELARVVTSVAVGAPAALFALRVAPMAPDPFVPDVSTPLKVITVMEETTLWFSVAVTVALVSFDVAKARQISEVPDCTLVLTTSTQVRPAPAMLLTVVLLPDAQSADTNASSNSLPAAVENEGVATVTLFVDRSVAVVTSIAIAADAELAVRTRSAAPSHLRNRHTLNGREVREGRDIKRMSTINLPAPRLIDVGNDIEQ
jgi:hypothetical protein